MENTRTNQLELALEFPACEPLATLRVIESGIDTLIFLKEVLLYQVPTNDKSHLRYIAVHLFLSHSLTQKEISKAFNVRRETISDWVKKYRAKGAAGLERKPKKNHKLTEEVMTRIAEFKAQKLTRVEIARILQLTPQTVYKAWAKLAELKKLSLPPELPDFQLQETQDEVTETQDEVTEIQDEVTETQDKVTEIQDKVTEIPGTSEASEEAVLDDLSACSQVDSVKYDGQYKAAIKSIDPLNRSVERTMASLGLLNDAVPIFAEHEHVENAGSLLAVAMLTQDCFLSSIEQTYKSFGASFYGLRNTFMSFFLMAVLRIKNIHSIEQKNGLMLGRLLGLDRSPCSKTLRRKLAYLTSRKQAMNTMDIIAQERIKKSVLHDSKDAGIVLYLDAHIHKYSGKGKFSKTFSTSKNRVVKGASDYYLNLPDGTPLLFIPTDFNQSMFEMMPTIIKHAKKICHDKKLTIVFDRGGSSAKTYETIMNSGCDFIAYHKSPKPVELKEFKKETTIINGNTYEHKPYDRSIELEVKERKGAVYKKTGRSVKVREIVVLRDDNKQTSILTSRLDLAAEIVAETIFRRWTQENYFKYGLEHYNIDAMCTYGTEEVTSGVELINPEHREATKKIKAIRKKMASLMSAPNEKMIEKEFELQQIQLNKIYEPKRQKKLIELAEALDKEKKFRKTIAPKISAEDYRKFNDESRLVSNLVKMTAYNVEGELANIFKEVTDYKNGNERGIVSQFTHTTGAFSISDESLLICLEKQATPAKTKELNALCQKINQLEAIYPGTSLTMQFSVQAC